MVLSKESGWQLKEFSDVIPGEDKDMIRFPEILCMYFDIHTHKELVRDENVRSVLNLNVPEFICCCGLNLQKVCYSLGIHPWEIKEDNLSKHIDFIEKNGVFESVKMIGECGLDKLCDTPWIIQLKVFVAMIKISEQLEKPLLIHCVKAIDELIALKKEFLPKQIWIIHGFRGKLEQADQLLKNGFFFSFGEKFNENTLMQIPLDRYFLETDASDCSIQQIYEQVSQILGMEKEDLVARISLNVNTRLHL